MPSCPRVCDWLLCHVISCDTSPQGNTISPLTSAGACCFGGSLSVGSTASLALPLHYLMVILSSTCKQGNVNPSFKSNCLAIPFLVMASQTIRIRIMQSSFTVVNTSNLLLQLLHCPIPLPPPLVLIYRLHC